ncbi:unnamed protein product [Heligmosomoides polygyrus]|uniref:DUF1758 domain-containing protein n=1 Tax=Heligmosomoides polygyrus TaxID=6339 RepID=A0A183FXE0_HELPZ|nr:unnamed protein product [Heligmosomoides polygyrus]
MIHTTVTLYADKNELLQIDAHKCYRDLIKVAAFNILHIRTTYRVIGRERLSISAAECSEAVSKNALHGHPLIEILPGLFSTTEIEQENISLTLTGTTIFKRTIYSFEKNAIAAIDDHTIISPLGNLDNCTSSTGSCLLNNAIVTWKPEAKAPSCRLEAIGIFDALVTLRFVLIPDQDLAFEFDQDYLKTFKTLQFCEINQGYLSTSQHILAFPDVPSAMMIQDYIIHHGDRRRRDVRNITRPDNRQSEYNLISEQPSLAIQVFGTKATPNFETNPITDSRLLQAIKTWNVTHQIFSRSRLYKTENQQISALRTIRYAEYRVRQLQQFTSVEKTRPLTYAEQMIQRDLSTGLTDIFDNYLNAEFGQLVLRELGNMDYPTPPTIHQY